MAQGDGTAPTLSKAKSLAASSFTALGEFEIRARDQTNLRGVTDHMLVGDEIPILRDKASGAGSRRAFLPSTRT